MSHHQTRQVAVEAVAESSEGSASRVEFKVEEIGSNCFKSIVFFTLRVRIKKNKKKTNPRWLDLELLVGFATSGALQIFFIADRIVSAIQSLSLLHLQYQFVFMLLGLQHASPTRFDSIDNHANLFLPARTCVPSLLLEGTVLLAPCHFNFKSGTCDLCDQQDSRGVQNTQNCLCIAAGIEIEKCAIGYQTSNQQSEK